MRAFRVWFDLVVEDDLGLMVILTGLNERSVVQEKTRILPLLVRQMPRLTFHIN